VPAEPITNYVITAHAEFEMERRRLSLHVVEGVLKAPEQRLQVRPGRDVLQSRLVEPDGEREYLIRVFVDVDRSPAEVVTAYKTSKVSKYWEEGS
jgi:hypothetical protein